jgi:dipeptidase E
MNLLLFSNSTNKGEEYFTFPVPHIHDFLGDKPLKIAFVPYAGVTISMNEYTEKVRARMAPLGYSVVGVHEGESPKVVVEHADVIMVGGGNSFALLKRLYDHDLVELIKKKVKQGTPYIGWSAGSNMACPTLKTTNDMPIVKPISFGALHLVPFQINPHYTEEVLPNHGGESRLQRLEEFLVMNPTVKVVALPEGTFLKRQGSELTFHGSEPMKILTANQAPQLVQPDSNLSELIIK